jgi:hypothetical protein
LTESDGKIRRESPKGRNSTVTKQNLPCTAGGKGGKRRGAGRRGIVGKRRIRKTLIPEVSKNFPLSLAYISAEIRES